MAVLVCLFTLHLSHLCSVLQRQHNVLCNKETLQLNQLDSYEMCLHHSAQQLHAAAADLSTAAVESPLLSAVLLDIQACELMLQLQPASSRMVSQPLSALHPIGTRHTPATCSGNPSNIPDSGGGGTSREPQAGGSTVACGSNQHTPGALNQDITTNDDDDNDDSRPSRTKRCLAAITTEDVLSTKGISVVELASELRRKNNLCALSVLRYSPQASPCHTHAWQGLQPLCVICFVQMCYSGVVGISQQ